MELIVKFLPLFGVLALAFVFIKSAWVTKQDQGTEKMIRIAKNITDGAMAFLKAEYKILAIFVVWLAESINKSRFVGTRIKLITK